MYSVLRKLTVIFIGLFLLGLLGSSSWAADYDKPIRIGWTAWSDAEAVTKIAKKILEEKMGYKVELVMSSIGIQYQGLVKGNIDLMMMAWLPITHQNYWKKFANDVVNLGPLYTRAKLGWVVPEYVPKDKISSIEDLTNPDIMNKLNREIIGIDPGSGLMQYSEEAMKEYGLIKKGYNLISSSGAGMTAALARAIKKKDWIIVTGWNPHWMFAKWDLRYLEDPKGVLGARERIHCLARKEFYQEAPFEVSEFFIRFFIHLKELEEVMLEGRNTSYEKAASNYIENNPKRIHYWITGEFE